MSFSSKQLLNSRFAKLICQTYLPDLFARLIRHTYSPDFSKTHVDAYLPDFSRPPGLSHDAGCRMTFIVV